MSMGSEETIRALKSSQRLQIIEKRRHISPDDRRRRSGAIWSALANLPGFDDASPLASYISYGEEVETVDGIVGLLRQGRRVAVPSMGFPDGEPAFSLITSWDELSANAFGILEPRREHLCAVAPHHIPFFLIPGVAFDLRGHRLGYGLGFYDRALSGVSARSLLVALAFETQIVDEVPVVSHDLPVDIIITEKRTIQTSARSRSIEEVC
jgi:5-formyltetrahydrofolate cyclo-ligase